MVGDGNVFRASFTMGLPFAGIYARLVGSVYDEVKSVKCEISLRQFTTVIYSYVSGATAAMLMTCLLFVLPNKIPRCKEAGPDGKQILSQVYTCELINFTPQGQIPNPPGPLMTWKYLQAKFPWDMVILIGGGMAMADGISSSGLSLYIGEIFSAFNSLSAWQMGVVVILIGTVITEAASNATIATIMTPVICAAAIEMKINPLYLVMAGGVAINLAFMLPIGTPANAVIFSMGLIQVVDMVSLHFEKVKCKVKFLSPFVQIKLGLVMNIHTTLTAILAANSWGRLLFDYNDFPQWARNTTSVAAANFTL
uniref:Uncharacterized protein n=1 Tax=Romanomermis culicivorax TaxID=13658 RepID=A0A915I4C0_ROMCU